MLLAEYLLLIALEDDEGTVPSSAATWLNYGLAGATLAELALRDQLVIVGKYLVAQADAAPADPLLADAYQTIARAGRRRDAKHWLRTLSGGSFKLRDRLLERLVERGVIRHEERRILWVIPNDRWPAQSGADEAAVKERLRALVLADARPEAVTVALLGLLRACNLERRVFTKDEWRDAKERTERLVADEPYSAAVRAIVQETTAAIIIATTTVGAAAATSSSN